jgi:hypothetical protein
MMILYYCLMTKVDWFRQRYFPGRIVTAVMRQARHDQQLRRYHDHNVKETSFNVGDLVLRRIQKTDDMHKLSAPLGRTLHRH